MHLLIAQSGGKAKKILGYCDNRGVHLPMSTDDYTILHENVSFTSRTYISEK